MQFEFKEAGNLRKDFLPLLRLLKVKYTLRGQSLLLRDKIVDKNIRGR